MGVFKAYDIRGVYNQDFNAETLYKIGFFLPQLLDASEIYVGRDTRLSSPEIFKALTSGILDAGCNVCDLGLCTTPAVYFATAYYKAQASVQITASHNPKEYNGLKISRAGAIPVGGESGLQELEQLVLTQTPRQAEKNGVMRSFDLKNDYEAFLKPFAPILAGAKLGVDCSNGMSSLYIKDLLAPLGAEVSYLFDTLDGSFPNHEPNPLEEENCAQIKALVREKKLDIGIIFDGDADRVMFIDEKGRFIRPDIITAVLIWALAPQPPFPVLVDIRTSRAVIETIEKLGGNVTVWKVGHAFAKLKMRELQAVLGGELAGHYYFKDFFNCDSGILACLVVLRALKRLREQGRTFSSLIDEINRYANSGEINFKIEDKTGAIAALQEYAEKAGGLEKTLDFDGRRFEYKDWWFNVRSSNTEPYLRLVMEAENSALLERRLTEAKNVLKKFVH